MRNRRIGIIGGGQLGMLLVQAAIPFPCKVAVYDPNPNCSAATFTENFTQGAFDDFDAIVAFGQQCDAVIFEIERVNVEALLELKKRGIRVLSSPESLRWIQDKGTQREFLTEHGLPGPSYQLVSADDLAKYNGPFPIVQKWRTGGYDGKGVSVHDSAESLAAAEAHDSVLEEKVDIDKEVSVLFARSEDGEMAIYPPVEMVFDPELNLIDHLLAPAELSKEYVDELLRISRELAEKCSLVGVYAIEFFIAKDGRILVNEVSPRTHNSGHHTVSANVCSQYEQQIRLALGLPLGSVDLLHPCIMVNLVADQSTGPTQYEGLEEAYKIPNVQFFFYGKKEVKPGRKMGHAIIFSEKHEEALQTLQKLRNTLTITAQ